MSKNKTAITIALFLILTIAVTLVAVPAANAHDPAWEIPTYAYVVAAPNPIGTGQEVHVYMWLDCVYGAAGGRNTVVPGNGSTASTALLANDYRFKNYKLTITDPDNHTTVQTFDTIWDTTSSQFTKFTPDLIGTYTLEFEYLGQVYGADGNGYEESPIMGDTYEASSASTTLTVQEEPIPAAINSYPLPTQYWTRPIYGENTDWWAISSNWLGTYSPAPGGASTLSTGNGPMYRNDAVGPQTSHVMWTRPLQFGGVVGGNMFLEGGSNPNGAAPGAAWFEGSSYQPRFVNPIIINGYLYYTEPISFSGPSSGPTDCVDLRTGEVLWSRTDVPPLAFGYIYNLWNPDQHGTFPAILFTRNFAQAFDAYTGDPLFNVDNVPSGTTVMGPSGEILNYVMRNAGTNADPQWYLSQWNSSKLWAYDIDPFSGRGSLSPSLINASNMVLISRYPELPTSSNYGDTIIVNADVPINAITLGQTDDYAAPITTYDWNVSIPWANTMTPRPSAVAARYGDILLLRSGSLPSGFAQTGSGSPQDPYTFFAVNLNASKGAIGQVLWTKTYDPPAGTLSLVQGPVDFDNRVFTFNYIETVQWAGFSLDTGKQLWTTQSETAFNYYDWRGYNPGVIAYGKLYSGGFGGVLYAYNDLTGEIEWTYGNGGEGNSTSSGLNNPYGVYPSFVQAIGNDVVYFVAEEHTIPNPLYKGTTARALNATTGEEIWQLSGYDSTWAYSGSEWAIADGFATMMNGLDNNIYSVGRGPSVTTVSAPQAGLAFGQSVVISGTVMDISAGTKQDQQAAVFPNGVPCASDDVMTEWMGYVYQQKPLPTDFTGVEVILSVVDSNNNCYDIGTTTTDSNGFFRYSWTPIISGDFAVFATFAGTNGYWPSQAETAFTVMQAPEATPGATQVPASVADIYLLPATIGIIITIIVATIVIVLMLRKR